MSTCTAEVEVEGHRSMHVVLVEFDLDMGQSAHISGGPSGLSRAEYDCGEGPSARIISVKMLRHADDRYLRRERAVHPAMLQKMRNDSRLEEILVAEAMGGMRHE